MCLPSPPVQLNRYKNQDTKERKFLFQHSDALGAQSCSCNVVTMLYQASDSSLVSCLRLLYSWRQLHLLLLQYAKYTPLPTSTHRQSAVTSSFGDFPSCDLLTSLYDAVEDSDDAIVDCIMVSTNFAYYPKP